MRSIAKPFDAVQARTASAQMRSLWSSGRCRVNWIEVTTDFREFTLALAVNVIPAGGPLGKQVYPV